MELAISSQEELDELHKALGQQGARLIMATWKAKSAPVLQRRLLERAIIISSLQSRLPEIWENQE